LYAIRLWWLFLMLAALPVWGVARSSPIGSFPEPRIGRNRGREFPFFFSTFSVTTLRADHTITK
jgi:hypothetical protein